MITKMFTIRKGVKTDCISINCMIKELADFMNMSNEVVIDSKQLEIDGFDDDFDKRLFHTFVAELNDTKELIGFVIYLYKYSSWKGKCIWMEEIYVKKQYRGIGVGVCLWSAVAKQAVEDCCARIDFICLDWNKNAIKLYERFGAKNLSEGWVQFRLIKSQIKELAEFC